MQPSGENPHARKIIHVDMDCFYAAIEMREHPDLAGKPIAVGGKPGGRGVLTTCNYEARKFGCRSALPAFKALELCPNLVILPVRHDLYRHEAMRIRGIFGEFTPMIEPLSLDEAYLDLSHLHSKGSSLAEEIRFRVRKETGLAASAGIAPNKLLAKIASDWNKPDGQFEITESDVAGFMEGLAVNRIWGVGKKAEQRLADIGVRTCGQLQAIKLTQLHAIFGQFGLELYRLCRGIDNREVTPNRERKSLSVERTFGADLLNLEEGFAQLESLLNELKEELSERHQERVIRAAFVKVKFTDFQQTTAECRSVDTCPLAFKSLLEEGWGRGEGKTVRLIGVGVRFAPSSREALVRQLELFE